MTRSLQAAALVLAACATGASAQADAGCASFTRDAALAQVNALRARGGMCGSRGGQAPAAALAWNERLQAAAQGQAQSLAARGTLAHTGPNGETLRERATAAGYDFARIAENVAYGQRSVAQVLAGWAASEGHCVNLYDSGVTEMALACVPGPQGRPYWALLVGRPAPP